MPNCAGILTKGLEKIAKGLGDFAGPLGSIAGGIIGSVIGGLFKKTPTGSIILGQGGVVGSSGNGGRQGEANNLGNSVLQSLDKIAKTLGVAASGQYSVSIGMRGDSYRVDTTGRGRTKESDVLNFGKDAQAAVLAAVKDAIGDGVFQGLNEGTKRFLLSGDLETQLAKFASFRGALDEADRLRDPQKFELAALAQAQTDIMSVANQVGATLEEIAKLEELFAHQRLEITEKYTAEALEQERTRRALEIQIMELSGDTVGALAAARELEKAQAAASLHQLYDRIYALQDEAKVAAEAAAVAQKTADERAGLDKRLLEMLGQTSVLRARELEALSPANRELQQFIYTLEDMQKVAAQRADLELRLAKATGNDKLVEQIEMANFLNQFDQSLRGMAMAVWEVEKAAEKAAQRQANRQARDQQLAASQEALAARYNAANDNAAEASQRYTAALEAQASALNDTISQFSRFSTSLRSFRDDLTLRDIPGLNNFDALRNRFEKTAGLAARGGTGALEGLPGIGREYLDALAARGGPSLDYQREAIRVAAAVDAALLASDRTVSDAQAQLQVLEQIKSGIEEVKAAVNRVVESVEMLDANNQSGQIAIAGNTRKTFQTLDQATDGGSAMRTKAA